MRDVEDVFGGDIKDGKLSVGFRFSLREADIDIGFNILKDTTDDERDSIC